MDNGIAICGDGTDLNLLEQEGIAEADVVVCITDDDRLNLMLALIAKHFGAKKTIVRVSRAEYTDLMEKGRRRHRIVYAPLVGQRSIGLRPPRWRRVRIAARRG